MKTLKHILTNWIRVKRLNVFVLFLLMALLISIVIKLSNEVTYTLHLELIPVHNNPREILTQKSPQYIDVTIKSNGFGVLKYAFSNLKIQTDFDTLEKKNNAYLWKEENQRVQVLKFFDSEMDIIAITPSTISFNFDQQAVKTLPVRIQSKINFAPGYDILSSVRSTPDSIDVIGPKAVLYDIDEIFTEPIILNNVNSNISQDVQLSIPTSSEGLILTPNKVIVRATVEKFTEGVVRVPVRLINVPEGQQVSIFPKEVSVVFYTSLQVYNAISPKDFVVECDFNTLEHNNDLLIPALISYPKAVKRVSLQLNQIEYVIKSSND